MSRPAPSSAGPAEARRNARLALSCLVGVAAMGGVAYASVPLYRIFCQVTGFDGTVRRADADAAPAQALERTLTVRFDTNVRNTPLRFRAEQVSQRLRIGETGLAFFEVTNTSDRPVVGQAVYNVVPEGAGAHFRKIECFCFSEQTIPAGATERFPMAYFIDPEFAADPNTRGAEEITLSYTFFPAG